MWGMWLSPSRSEEWLPKATDTEPLGVRGQWLDSWRSCQLYPDTWSQTGRSAEWAAPRRTMGCWSLDSPAPMCCVWKTGCRAFSSYNVLTLGRPVKAFLLLWFSSLELACLFVAYKYFLLAWTVSERSSQNKIVLYPTTQKFRKWTVAIIVAAKIFQDKHEHLMILKIQKSACPPWRLSDIHYYLKSGNTKKIAIGKPVIRGASSHQLKGIPLKPKGQIWKSTLWGRWNGPCPHGRSMSG